MPEPQLTIVVAAPVASPTLSECLDVLASQVRGREIEVLVSAATAGGVQLVRERFPQFTAIEAPASSLLPELWGAGVTRAQGRILALTSGACIPAHDWVDTILRAHVEYHSAIGGTVDIAPHSGLVTWALYFIRYSAFMPPLAAGPADVCAENGSYKRVAIADQLAWIGAHGFWDHEVNERMHAQMRSRWREPLMVVTCKEGTGGSLERFRTGHALGRLRAAQFSRRRRVLQFLKTPLLPWVYPTRIARIVFQTRRHRVAFVLCLPLIAWYLSCWSAGQFLGLRSASHCPNSSLMVAAVLEW